MAHTTVSPRCTQIINAVGCEQGTPDSHWLRLGRILNHSPRGRNFPLIVCNLHHSIRSQLDWTNSWRKSLAWSWSVLVNSGQAWVTKREIYSAGLLTYGKAMWLTSRSSGNITQCAYIGYSIERSWFIEIIMWSRVRGVMSVQLIVGPCKGHGQRTLNSP